VAVPAESALVKSTLLPEATPIPEFVDILIGQILE